MPLRSQSRQKSDLSPTSLMPAGNPMGRPAGACRLRSIDHCLWAGERLECDAADVHRGKPELPPSVSIHRPIGPSAHRPIGVESGHGSTYANGQAVLPAQVASLCT
jgi:hypothetical protein